MLFHAISTAFLLVFIFIIVVTFVFTCAPSPASTAKPGRAATRALDLDAGEAPLMTLEEAMKAHQDGSNGDEEEGTSGSDGGSDGDGDSGENNGDGTGSSSSSSDNAAIEAAYAAELKRAEKLARAEALAERKQQQRSSAAKEKDGEGGGSSKLLLGDRKISKRVRKADGRGDAPHGRYKSKDNEDNQKCPHAHASSRFLFSLLLVWVVYLFFFAAALTGLVP